MGVFSKCICKDFYRFKGFVWLIVQELQIVIEIFTNILWEWHVRNDIRCKIIKPIFLNSFSSILFLGSSLPAYEEYLYLYERYIVFYFGMKF